MDKINVETAQKDVERWLDLKKIGSTKRQSMKDSIEGLVEGIRDGILSINEKGEIQQTLKFPLGEDESIKTLVFKPRISIKEVKPYLKEVKGSDVDGRLAAYVAALTNTSKDIIEKMDSEDSGISNSIAVFFL